MQPVSATPLSPPGYPYVPQAHPIPVLQQQWAASQLLQNQPLQGDQWILTAAENKPPQKQTNWQRIWQGDPEKLREHRDWFECWIGKGQGLKSWLMDGALYGAIALGWMALTRERFTRKAVFDNLMEAGTLSSFVVATHRYCTQDKKA